MHCVVRWAKIIIEGHVDQFFTLDTTVTHTVAAQANIATENIGGTELDADIFHALNQIEDIAMVQAQGLMVDDDNDPAPENVPEPSAPLPDITEEPWGWNGQDHRKIFGAQNL